MKVYSLRCRRGMASMVDLGAQHQNLYSFLRLSCWDARFVFLQHYPSRNSNIYITASTLIIIITQDDTSFVLGSLLLGFLLGSNLWTTSIIAWRAWFVWSHCFYTRSLMGPCQYRRQHRQFIKAQLGEGTARTNAEKILSHLIESGAIYCFIWVRS